MQTWEVDSVDELTPIVSEVLAACRASEGEGATVLALSGDLGAGKTTFTQKIAAALGVEETVTSPTFVIQKQYSTTDAYFHELVHIDAYRIETLDELRPLHFSELLTRPHTLVVIEWAERIAAALPATHATMSFTIVGDRRQLTFHHV